MNRRTLIFALGTVVASLPGKSSYAQSLRSGPPSWGLPWGYIPEVVIISTECDYRLPAVREALDFWNTELSKLGSPFRFGRLAHIVETISPLPHLRDPLPERLVNHMAKVLSGMAPTGDVIVLLSNDSNFDPFTEARPDLRKVIVAIPDLPPYARTLRGRARNNVAHELGHAIGLGHNDDANTLMCGGGAQCGFESPEEFLPITVKEKTKLLEMYPPNWQPKPTTKWIADPPYPLSSER